MLVMQHICKDQIKKRNFFYFQVTARLRQPQDGLYCGTVDAVDPNTSTYRYYIFVINYEIHRLLAIAFKAVLISGTEFYV